MSKSIYEVALKELTWLVHDEFYETPKSSILNASQRLDKFKKVRDTLEQAQKQEKLLEFYKKLNNLYEELYAIELSELALNSNFYEIEIIKLKYQIKELEND